ncbi:DUF1796 family putative cysteine peptidase [Cohnella sp. AR92]|uniref:DUF1796 family putative cysteine peptidase n=1 Tax=Cohnella sp. AR92 TaxID=648716 RepID=UPI0013158050|nr:DUF1796 family putative cysteine peptidase [Cohnella sp. AR92]
MRWYDCAGAYKAFVSLGATCQTAHQLRRLGLRRFAGPLDWFISRNASDISRLVSNRFDGLLNVNRLQVVGIDQTNHVIRDTGYNLESYHDFPAFQPWTVAYPEVASKLRRRAQAVLSAGAGGPLCFVRTEASESQSLQLQRALSLIAPRGFRLLVVNFKDEYRIRHEDWGFPGIASISIPTGHDWRGYDQAWWEIMHGFSVAGG